MQLKYVNQGIKYGNRPLMFHVFPTGEPSNTKTAYAEKSPLIANFFIYLREKLLSCFNLFL